MTDALISALRKVLVATAEEEEAKAQSAAANLPFIGFPFVGDRIRAEEAFAKALEYMIDERVRIALSASQDQP